MNLGSNLDDLASEFFRVFSRMEYALKATGFHGGDGDAKADWGKFAKQIEHLFVNPSDDDLRRAISFILSYPPKKQKIVGGVLTWETCPISSNSRAYKLLMYVCRVRNNLFHGGKFSGQWFEPERSEPLLRNCLTILQAAIEGVPRVREAYLS